jgi:GNAT superfamily N-acetyltransferase
MSNDTTLSFHLHDITGINDPYLPAALDLYQDSFPDRERVPLSWWFALCKHLEDGKPTAEDARPYSHPEAHRFLSVCICYENDVERVGAVVQYEAQPGPGVAKERVGFIAYLATSPELRGKGMGGALFDGIVERLQKEENCRLVLWEVEDPEEIARSQGEKEAELARRRIGFYRRCGGKLLGGVEYLLHIGRPFMTPFPAFVMVAGPADVTPEEVQRVADYVLGGVPITGALTLD